MQGTYDADPEKHEENHFAAGSAAAIFKPIPGLRLRDPLPNYELIYGSAM